MAKRGALDVPVIGVSSSKWTRSQLHERATNSISDNGGIDDEAALKHLLSKLQYVSGNYNDAATFQLLRQALGEAQSPAFYLAIPPRNNFV